MHAGAQLSVIEMRNAARRSVDHAAMAEHPRLGAVLLHLKNLSPQGFMIQGELALQRGERLEIQLPVIGRIDAHLVWAHEGRAGFQFERLIRQNDFVVLADALQPGPGLIRAANRRETASEG